MAGPLSALLGAGDAFRKKCLALFGNDNLWQLWQSSLAALSSDAGGSGNLQSDLETIIISLVPDSNDPRLQIGSLLAFPPLPLAPPQEQPVQHLAAVPTFGNQNEEKGTPEVCSAVLSFWESWH